MPQGLGYGSAVGLEKVLSQQFERALEAQRIKEQQRAFQLQQQRLDQDRSASEALQNYRSADLGLRTSDVQNRRNIATEEAERAQQEQIRGGLRMNNLGGMIRTLVDPSKRPAALAALQEGGEVAPYLEPDEEDSPFMNVGGGNVFNTESRRFLSPPPQQGGGGAGSGGGGRGLLSGDANRVSELDTSLDDLRTLRSTLATDGPGSQPSTGFEAGLGAVLPNAVSEITGIGTEAKQRQAVIDRVRQVIGKALEGGVLRKEDEAKYTKILPTITDQPEIVEAKLDGLEQAIILRRQRLLESLTASGFDTSGFDQRSGSAGPSNTQPSPTAEDILRQNGVPLD